MTDAELVHQTLAGRNEAYAELVHRWAGRVTALCHAKVGCAAAADDLAQDALLRGFQMLSSLTSPEKFGPWLCRIALHACLNWLKAKERSLVPFSALEAGPGGATPGLWVAAPEFGPDQEHEDELQKLREEVASLPETYRQVLLLYYHQDITYRDLSEILGVSCATINARLTKARTLLRERLNQCRR
jgi:RNA polymerase sigma factor (sigma-70 family)